MKWILLLSVILNGILGYQLLQKKEVVREEIVEKVVVKKAAPEIIEKKVIVEVPGETKVERVGPVEFDEVEMEDTVENVSKKREDFLVGKLGFSDRDFQAIENIKRSYIERYQKLYKPEDGPLSIAQRKAMLQLEEERDAEFARAVGPQKWKEWESFRDSYNKKLWKRSMKSQSGVIVPMEI